MSVIFGGPTVPLEHLVQLRESVKGSIPENVHNTQATKAFSDEDFMSLLMDNSTDPRALFCVDLMFPTAKGVYEHYPRSFLKSTLSYMQQELRQLAVGYLIFNAVQAKRKFTLSDASQVKLEYPQSKFAESGIYYKNALDNLDTYLGFIDKELPEKLVIPLEFVTVWNAVDAFVRGFVKSSMKHIAYGKVGGEAEAEAEKLPEQKRLKPRKRERTIRGSQVRHKRREWPPLTNIRRGIYRDSGLHNKPQHWSLPLKRSEMHQLKRALWRVKIFTVLTHQPRTFGVDEGEIYPSDDIYLRLPTQRKTMVPIDHHCLLFNFFSKLHPFEWSKMEAVFGYVCRGTVERVHHHHIDGFMLDHDNISCVNRWDGQIEPHDEGEDICCASGSSERLCQYHVLEWSKTDHKRYLAYEMSKGLPFLRQVQQQIERDGDQIVHANHVELRYPSVYGFRLVVDHVRENHTWHQIWPILTQECPFEDSPGCHL